MRSAAVVMRDAMTALGHPTLTFGRYLKIASTTTPRTSVESKDEMTSATASINPQLERASEMPDRITEAMSPGRAAAPRSSRPTATSLRRNPASRPRRRGATQTMFTPSSSATWSYDAAKTVVMSKTIPTTLLEMSCWRPWRRSVISAVASTPSTGWSCVATYWPTSC